MIFDTRVNGIPCVCKVIDYSPYIPMQVYGPDMGDADPPEGATFDFAILDQRHKPAPWLEKYLTDADTDRLLKEFHILQRVEYYDCAQSTYVDFI